MKRFLQQFGLFSIFLSISSAVYFYAFLYPHKEIERIGNETYISLKKAVNVPPEVKTVILGDSTGNQIYPNTEYNSEIYSLCCNQAISMAGQYILLYKFLQNHQDPQAIDILLVARPSSFRNNLDQRFVYNYFIKPFYREENKDLLTSHAEKQIRQIPFRYLVKIPFIRKSNWSPNLNDDHRPHYFHISELSAEYIHKMQQLCQEKNVKSFKIRCTFLSKEFPREQLSGFNKEIIKLGLDQEFSGYFNTLKYYGQELFMNDKVHLKNPAIADMDLLEKRQTSVRE
ncbi:MAG: hypothetical protein HOL08_08625 [Opitutae bacterium]|nr:hypothetical protein [Opitutae bacterium]